METQSRIFKVVVQFQEKDEVFYTRIKSQNGIPASLLEIIVSRYPSLSSLVKRCYVKDKTGAEFAIINNDDLSVFLDGEDLFENVVQVEINGVQRDSELVSPAKKVRIAEQEVSLPAKDDDEMMKPVHKNVICDCCDQTIVGYRYKCSECFNFDLCMTCEGKMRHREHIMIRIPEPSLSYSPCRFVKLNRGTNTTETAQPCGEEKSRRHHHKRHHHRRHGGRPHTMFDGLFRQFDPEGLVSDPDTDTPPQQGAQSNTENAATGGVPPPQPPYDFQKLVKAVETVAGNVAKFLEPLGMTMDYDFPTATGTASASCPFAAKTPTPTETVTPAKEKTPEPSVMVIDDSLEKSPENKEPIPSTSTASVPEPFIVDVIEDEPEKQSSIIEPTTAGDRSSPASNISGDDAEWLVISNEGLPDSPQKEATPVSVPDPIAPQIPAVASTSAQTHGYDELARKLQKDIEEQLRINSATASTQTSITVQQPTVLVQQPTVPVIHHPAPHINMSIQRMIDMGFSNDGDSLTNLMVCCNGDIRRALDMLLHKK